MMDVDFIFKIVIIGDSGVGKTSFVHSLNNDNTCTKGSTIGVDFAVHTSLIDEKRVKAQIWDTAGQEQFRSITKSYFRNVAGALVFFDVSDKQSYINVKSWINDLIAHGVHENTIMCIANKTDLIPYMDIPEFYDENNFHILQNSLKTPLSSQQTFHFFLSHLYNLYKTNHIRVGVKNIQLDKPHVTINNDNIQNNKYCYC